MASALRDMFTDTSTLPLITLAVCTAGYASYRANEVLLKQRDPSWASSAVAAALRPGGPGFLSSQALDEHTHMLQGSAAMAFPVIAAISITLLFFFLRSIGVIFTALSTVSGFFALMFVLWPMASYISARFHPWLLSPRQVPSLSYALALVPTVGIMIAWLLTGNWLTNNIIGVSFCILFASVCRVPNLKVVAILFTGLFFYDIFFVFFSERLFGRNVMVEVATTAPTNPASAIASWLNLPFNPVKNLALPAKLIIPTADGAQAILGLGDIVLPEVLLTYLLDFDIRSLPAATPLTLSYLLTSGLFVPSLVAYAFAIVVSFFCNYTFRAAQPALLYIVPSVLGTSALLAVSRKQWPSLWNGLLPTSPVSHHDDDVEDVHDDHSRASYERGVPNEFPNLQLNNESYTLLNSNHKDNSTLSLSHSQQYDRDQQV